MMELVDAGRAARTVVVSGVPETLLPAARMADKLVIHFQSSRSHGGDVEKILYPTNFKDVAFVTFDKNTDAERVVGKEQILKDKEFPEEYHLTVFKFTPDVYLFVSALVDLSGFSERESLVEALRSAHGSVRICPLPRQSRAAVQGPFTAVRALRVDLLSRARAETGHSRWVQEEAGPSPDESMGSSSSAGLSRAQQGAREEEEEEEEEVVEDWVDTNTLMYIQKFNKEDLHRCLAKHDASVRFEDGAEDLTHVSLRSKRAGEFSGARGAWTELEGLVSYWQAVLRVHAVACEGRGPAERERLLRVCVETAALLGDVLCVELDSGVKVVGPSASSHLLCEWVKDKMDKAEERSYLDV